MSVLHQYEQFKPFSHRLTWLILILAACMLVAWGVLFCMVIPSAPRHWNFDTYVDTPAESVFSTAPPPPIKHVPPQIELPPNRVNRAERIE
jgi:hypothetical protein